MGLQWLVFWAEALPWGMNILNTLGEYNVVSLKGGSCSVGSLGGNFLYLTLPVFFPILSSCYGGPGVVRHSL